MAVVSRDNWQWRFTHPEHRQALVGRCLKCSADMTILSSQRPVSCSECGLNFGFGCPPSPLASGHLPLETDRGPAKP